MTDKRIEKIKSAVESAENIPADKKTELLRLLLKLQPAIAKISETHREHAQSIARLVEASAHEATRTKKKTQLIKRLLHELKQSMENFEASHPELVALVTEYTAFLAAVGV
jgi:prefoldin subunit 5